MTTKTKLTLACILVVAGLFLSLNESSHIWVNIIGAICLGIGAYLGNMAVEEQGNDYL